MKTFNMGDVVKMKCLLGYSRENGCIFLTARGIELISKARIVVT